MPLPKIFISYSHKDEEEKDALVAQLRPLKQHGVVWYDDLIGAGENWEQKINAEMEQATVAVLLITANFLNSDTIERLELPKLLARQRTDGLPIIPIIARFCPWLAVDWLTTMNVRPKNGTPVWSRHSDPHEELYKIALEVVEVLKAEEQRRAASDSPLVNSMTTTQASQRGVAIGGDQSGVVVTGNVQNLYINTPAPEQARQTTERAEQERVAKEKAEKERATRAREQREKEERDRRLKEELILTLAPNVTLELVRVPAGEFLMGSDKSKDNEAYDDELPQHMLYLDAYLIGKYPVTVAQFATFAQATKYKTTAEKDGSSYAYTGDQWEEVKGADWQHPRGPASNVARKANHPVTHVSWDDARAFCEWASQVTSRTVRLPTEAEWEKAARGIDGKIYPWGNDVPNDQLCNFNLNVKDTTPVGNYSPRGDSPYHCADMAGNVWEWTSSLWGKNVSEPDFKYPYRADDGRENPDDRDGARVLRGGSFRNGQRLVRCAYRDRILRHARNELNGLRIFCAPSL